MRRRVTALLIAGLASLAPDLAAGASAPAASSWGTDAVPFELVPHREPPRRSQTLFWSLGATGVGLIAASFPLAHAADQRYADYLAETDPAKLDERFSSTRRMDRLASASLWTGEAMLVTAVWIRFVRLDRPADRVSLTLEPARCAVSLRF